MAAGGRYVWVPDGYHVVISDGMHVTEIAQSGWHTSTSTEFFYSSSAGGWIGEIQRMALKQYLPGGVNLTGKAKRLACRTGWRVAQVRIMSVVKRSARRIRRGFGRENVGCWNYCRSPA